MGRNPRKRLFHPPAKAKEPPSEGKMMLNVRRKNAKGETPLHVAAIRGNAAMIKLFVGAGAEIDVLDYAGWTALHEACNHGNLEAVDELLKSGANVNVLGCDNITPLHDAVTNAHKEVVKLLLRHGGDPLLKNTEGETCMDLTEDEEIMQLLTAENYHQESAENDEHSQVVPQPPSTISNTLLVKSEVSNDAVVPLTGSPIHQHNNTIEIGFKNDVTNNNEILDHLPYDLPFNTTVLNSSNDDNNLVGSIEDNSEEKQNTNSPCLPCYAITAQAEIKEIEVASSIDVDVIEKNIPSDTYSEAAQSDCTENTLNRDKCRRKTKEEKLNEWMSGSRHAFRGKNKEERAQLQFDLASRRNRLRLEHAIKTGEFDPNKKTQQSKKVTKKRFDSMTKEEKESLERSRKLYRQRFTANMLDCLATEKNALKELINLRQALCLPDIDIEASKITLEKMQTFTFRPLILKRNPEIVLTVRACTYHSDKKIREKSESLYNSFQAMFMVPEDSAFVDAFLDTAAEYKEEMKDFKKELKGRVSKRKRELNESEKQSNISGSECSLSGVESDDTNSETDTDDDSSSASGLSDVGSKVSDVSVTPSTTKSECKVDFSISKPRVESANQLQDEGVAKVPQLRNIGDILTDKIENEGCQFHSSRSLNASEALSGEQKAQNQSQDKIKNSSSNNNVHHEENNTVSEVDVLENKNTTNGHDPRSDNISNMERSIRSTKRSDQNYDGDDCITDPLLVKRKKLSGDLREKQIISKISQHVTVKEFSGTKLNSENEIIQISDLVTTQVADLDYNCLETTIKETVKTMSEKETIPVNRTVIKRQSHRIKTQNILVEREEIADDDISRDNVENAEKCELKVSHSLRPAKNRRTRNNSMFVEKEREHEIKTTILHQAQKERISVTNNNCIEANKSSKKKGKILPPQSTLAESANKLHTENTYLETEVTERMDKSESGMQPQGHAIPSKGQRRSPRIHSGTTITEISNSAQENNSKNNIMQQKDNDEEFERKSREEKCRLDSQILSQQINQIKINSTTDLNSKTAIKNNDSKENIDQPYKVVSPLKKTGEYCKPQRKRQSPRTQKAFPEITSKVTHTVDNTNLELERTKGKTLHSQDESIISKERRQSPRILTQNTLAKIAITTEEKVQENIVQLVKENGERMTHFSHQGQKRKTNTTAVKRSDDGLESLIEKGEQHSKAKITRKSPRIRPQHAIAEIASMVTHAEDKTNNNCEETGNVEKGEIDVQSPCQIPSMIGRRNEEKTTVSSKAEETQRTSEQGDKKVRKTTRASCRITENNKKPNCNTMKTRCDKGTMSPSPKTTKTSPTST